MRVAGDGLSGLLVSDIQQLSVLFVWSFIRLFISRIAWGLQVGGFTTFGVDDARLYSECDQIVERQPSEAAGTPSVSPCVVDQ